MSSGWLLTVGQLSYLVNLSLVVGSRIVKPALRVITLSCSVILS